MIKIKVIFTCFNRKEKTIKCIESLVNGNLDYELSFIVIDDNSSDGTKEEISKLDYDINLLTGSGELYWAGGMRKGIAQIGRAHV